MGIPIVVEVFDVTLGVASVWEPAGRGRIGFRMRMGITLPIYEYESGYSLSTLVTMPDIMRRYI